MLGKLPPWLPLFPAGLAGALLAAWLGLPMPFMLGGILGAGLTVATVERRQGPTDLRIPKYLRMGFVAVIGTMIGAGFSPDLLAVLPGFWPSVLAMLAFIGLSHGAGYVVMRRVGGYGRIDALFAAMPGGLVEAQILGERAGADPRRLAVQHFIRIVLVVSLVPLIFWVATGDAVGSAAGQSLGRVAWNWADLGLIAAISAIGMAAGPVLRLPAGHLMGPLFLCAGLQVAGLVTLAPPGWLLDLAQLVVGVGLGAQFSGLGRGILLRGLGTGIVAVAAMLVIGFALALALAPLVPAGPAALFLAYAPGGVTEMNLIALSLDLSPVVVAVHHLARIVLTVLITSRVAARLLAAETPTMPD